MRPTTRLARQAAHACVESDIYADLLFWGSPKDRDGRLYHAQSYAQCDLFQVMPLRWVGVKAQTQLGS